MNLDYSKAHFMERVKDNKIAEACGLSFNRQQKFDLKVAKKKGL